MADWTIADLDEIIDTRDIIDRIEDLQDRDDLDEDETQELADLESFANEYASSIPDWEDGESLIRDNYFVTYAQELAEDIGAIDRNADWPLTYIDWDAAADALKQDYTEVELRGITYWTHA